MLFIEWNFKIFNEKFAVNHVRWSSSMMKYVTQFTVYRPNFVWIVKPNGLFVFSVFFINMANIIPPIFKFYTLGHWPF